MEVMSRIQIAVNKSRTIHNLKNQEKILLNKCQTFSEKQEWILDIKNKLLSYKKMNKIKIKKGKEKTTEEAENIMSHY